METNSNLQRKHAHAFLDRLPEDQVAAVCGLLETMLSPLDRKLAVAPLDDEPVTEEEERAIAASKKWFENNPGIPFEEVVAELGFTMEQICGDKGSA